MPLLKNDTYSNQNPNRLYGRAGEEVAIIEDRSGVLVVRIEGGEPFCVLACELSREGDPDPPSVKVKAPKPPQGSLF